MQYTIIKKCGQRGMMLLMLGLLAACAQKADALKLSAHQFSLAADKAITSLDDMRTAEFAAPVQSKDVQEAEFIANLNNFTGTLTASNIPVLINPDAITIDPDVNAKWQQDMANLRHQYQQFDAIFTDIGEDDLFGIGAIHKAGPILQKLRRQLAKLGQTLGTTPPVFMVRRDALVAAINKIHEDKSTPADTRTGQIKAWWQQWQQLQADEQQSYQTALQDFVIAGQLGAQLQNQIANYSKISTQSVLKDIEDGLTFVAENQGLGMKQLKHKADSVILQTLAGQSDMGPATTAK
ncbi:hypothetical protein TH25_15530 [Thalassospira profundimaris]|uniref:Lipoprotein n=1 Tax=Thalassospira profundimaris TaxID=502049 RepID=A0A367X4R3_9PROT|nr:hypothetical protein [Thalassospira profundimaris]RCK47682.1 hypothetical protein TH25_15530 [Thalassospira profundimaris]